MSNARPPHSRLENYVLHTARQESDRPLRKVKIRGVYNGNATAVLIKDKGSLSSSHPIGIMMDPSIPALEETRRVFVRFCSASHRRSQSRAISRRTRTTRTYRTWYQAPAHRGRGPTLSPARTSAPLPVTSVNVRTRLRIVARKSGVFVGQMQQQSHEGTTTATAAAARRLAAPHSQPPSGRPQEYHCR